MRKKNKLIIVITIVFALAIASAVFAYLFLATDIFKSEQELFSKYLSQNIDIINQMIDLDTIKVYENLKDENKYVSNTNFKTIHSEGGEISNPLNNLTAKLNIQKDINEQYAYVDAQILYEDEEYLEAELIKEKEIQGIRFTDAVKQFITIKKDENTELVAQDMGITPQMLELIINTLSENGENLSKVQINTLKDKYLNIIIQELMKGNFQKQKDAMITYNNVTTKTNAYSVIVTSDQVQNIVIQLLNNLKIDEEILEKLQAIIEKETVISEIEELINMVEELQFSSVKITVYERKQETIRTVIEIGENKITIENDNQAQNAKINIFSINDEETNEYQIEINKQNTENEEKIQINANVLKGEQNYFINIFSTMQKFDDNINLKLEINHKENITTTSLVIENKIENNFEKQMTLSNENNIVISSIQQEKRKALINVLNQIVPQKVNDRVKILKEKLGIATEEIENQSNSESIEENSEAQTEINKFNAKFEFYTGDEVSAENVKTLLNVVKNNFGSCEVFQENNTSEQSQLIEVIKLNIQKEIINEEEANRILEKINDDKKYKVLIFYKEGNGLIDYITITEI